jgi:hypothetical protein
MAVLLKGKRGQRPYRSEARGATPSLRLINIKSSPDFNQVSLRAFRAQTAVPPRPFRLGPTPRTDHSAETLGVLEVRRSR